MKYKIKRIDDFPEHVKGACYAILDNGHTMLPEDVIRRLNDANKLLQENSTSTNKQSVSGCSKCGCRIVLAGYCAGCQTLIDPQ